MVSMNVAFRDSTILVPDSQITPNHGMSSSSCRNLPYHAPFPCLQSWLLDVSLLMHSIAGPQEDSSRADRVQPFPFVCSWYLVRFEVPVQHISKVFAENFGWVGFLVVCFLYETTPNPPRNIGCGKKSGQIATFDLIFFLGLGWPWVGEFRRFHYNIYSMFSNPTEFGKSKK